MPPPIKSGKQVYGGRVFDESEIPSSNLWVGNLSTDVTESDLMSLFSKYGAVDSICSYVSRTYAFVYYKRVEDAKAAVEALRGRILRGNPLRIDFAKPAKPCKSLWVSGISPSITKETLEQEFLKFGKIEEFKFLRDRNTAYVDYLRLEDASQALKSMNGKRIGGDHIRVDFLRSHSTRREHLADYRDAREGQFLSRIIGPPDSPWMPKEANRSYPEPSHSGSERQLHLQSSGRQMGDGPPSNILWILYPPSVLIDEQMLHNAMILFGEIERIRSFPGKPYMFVEFRSVDEARRAKEGLQGRLFNDPRISILYSSSELVPSKDLPGSYPEVKGPRADVFFNEPPFQPAQLDIPNHNRPVVPNTLSGPATSSVIPGPNMLTRPFGPQGRFESPLSRPEFNDLAALHKHLDANPNGSIGGPNWRRSPPAPGMLPSPSLGAKRPTRAVSGAWDVFDASQLERESKRSRMDTVLPVSDIVFPSRNVDDRGLGLDQFYGVGPQVGGGASGPLATVQQKNPFSPAEVRVTTSGANRRYPDHDYIWRGVIAKGGTPVCRARCVPIGKGIESEIPEVVNCSARTGLDLLSKHYADATGYNIVFFLPDSEEDFASYTEFLRYLGSKDRAGVAKFDDGTTLFLVPPSDFLSKVLNIVGPQRLYGVVLKFSQHAPSSTSMQPQSFQPHFMDRGQMLSQNDNSSIPQKDKEVLQMDYNKVLHEDSLPSTTHLPPPTSDSIPMQPATSVNTALVSQAGLLTPQLIAALASFLPANATSSATETAQTQVSSVSMRPPLPPSTELVGGHPPQGWTHDRQGPEQPALPLHQVENQYKPQGQEVAQLQIYPTVLNTSTISAIGVTDNSQVQDPSFHLPQQGAVSSRPFGNIGTPSQSGQVSISPQFDQVHQYEVPQNAQKGFGIPHVIDSYGSSAYQQPGNHVALSDQIHGSNVTQSYTAMQLGADKGNSQFPNQVPQHQSVHCGASQGTSEVGDDKNQRYHSALQFAFNLLNQVQQKSGSQSGQGSANH